MQSVEEESGDEAGSSNAGVQYSEDLSDAMFNRLMQADDHSESGSEVDAPPAPAAVTCIALQTCHALCAISYVGVSVRSLACQASPASP